MESLEQWSKYRKGKYDHKYPIDDKPFNDWIKLDFNSDGIPDFKSPYQLRKILAEEQLDFNNQVNKYILGRALYHIAQRRGFKSSKGETLSKPEADVDMNSESTEDDALSSNMKDSEKQSSSILRDYMEKNGLKTAGQAFSKLEEEGVRVRGSEYQAVRSMYKEEINYIFSFQNQLSTESDFYKHLVSEKKNEGTIFYKLPLRSQKKLVGKCTLEPNKYRCSLSHPEYERFKALSFLNNIKFRTSTTKAMEQLPLPLRKDIYEKSFISKVRDYFPFKEIRIEIEKHLGVHLNYTQDKRMQTINYPDNFSVDGCPVTVRFINLFPGEDWHHAILMSDKEKLSHSGNNHQVSYSASDLWNICFMADSSSEIKEFAQDRLGWNEGDKKTNKLVSLFGAIAKHSQYGMLSLKALRNINAMLAKGFKYSDAVIMAKIPDIVPIDNDAINNLSEYYRTQLLPSIQYQHLTRSIANKLIANYKSLNLEYRFADHDTNYILQDSDYKDIKSVILSFVGEREYEDLNSEDKYRINKDVENLYQQFFNSTDRDFLSMPTIKEAWASFLHKQYPNVPLKKWQKLYHPSQINFFHHSNDGKLGTPNIGAIKNPVALRTLNILRSKVNSLIEDRIIIPDDTKVVIETARDMNDANMRWAIAEWDKQREQENKEIENILSELHQNSDPANKDKVRYALEQSEFNKYDISEKQRRRYKIDIKKYRLWREQDCRCMYTGKVIELTKLFDGHSYNFEHTLPLSQSLDNSDSNLTICDAHYNQKIKGTLLPTALPNYDKIDPNHPEYKVILSGLEKWETRLKKLQERVDFWRWRAKHAQDKPSKDFCIRQMHLWSFDAEYWKKKLGNFKVTEIKDSFRHSQLVDTRIITKYATLYLKSVFSNVDVQKGEVTSVFRKILGIQDENQKKDRSNNAHHAIDATMLTLMPAPAKRERMLRLFYQRAEKKQYRANTYDEDSKLKEEIKGLQIGKDVNEIAEYIEKNILVEHPKRRNPLKPSTHYLTKKENGKKVRVKYTEQSVIRGQLHKQTYLGRIKPWKKDSDGSIKRNAEGLPMTEEMFVSREPLKYKANTNDSGFGDWKELSDKIVNKDLVPMMQKQFPEGTSFREACDKGIFMLDKKGKKVNKIRTVRVKRNVTASGAKIIKEQTYKSGKDYKDFFYAQVGDLYAGCEYSDGRHKMFRIFSLIDVRKNNSRYQHGVPDSIIDNKNRILKLKRILRPGDTILLYNEPLEELLSMGNEVLSKRLYTVSGFESDGRISLVKSSFAGKATKGKPLTNFQDLPEVIRSGMSRLHYLQEGKGLDFSIRNGCIIFNPKI